MDLFVVSYDLVQGAREDYEDLYKAIESYGIATPVLESTWIVAAENSTDAEICNYLERFIEPEDELFVAWVADDGAPTPKISSAHLDDDTAEAVARILWWWTR